jgi:Fe-S cluster assembly protein SufD
MIATQESTQKQSYLEAFGAFREHAAGSDLRWLRALRNEAFQHFWETGFPTTRDEDWRFTNLAPLASTEFRLAADASVTREQIAEIMPSVATRLVFVNGRYAPELSMAGAVPAGVRIKSLREALETDSDFLQTHMARYADFRSDAFTALNTAFIDDGAFVYVPAKAVVEEPIYILYVATGSEVPSMTHPRNLIIAGEDAQVTVVEDYVTVGASASTQSFSNVVTELVAGEHSVVAHYMVEREDARSFNISTLRMQQGRSSSVHSHSVLLGSGLVRNNVHPVLAGEGADCLVNGLFVGNGRQHMDNYMLVEHASPHCESRQFYNGILDGHARGVFHGRIIVHKDAQKTDAKQTNRNLLLSDDAQIDTKPQLEIYADDVKCTHGATIGQIEPDALFYLRSRGLSESEARALLLVAFAGECIERMKPGPIRKWLDAMIHDWLPRYKR